MNYEFNKYLVYKLPNDDVVIQNDKSIVKVNNEKMKKFLLINDENYKKELVKNELDEYFGSYKDQALSFLLQYN